MAEGRSTSSSTWRGAVVADGKHQVVQRLGGCKGAPGLHRDVHRVRHEGDEAPLAGEGAQALARGGDEDRVHRVAAMRQPPPRARRGQGVDVDVGDRHAGRDPARLVQGPVRDVVGEVEQDQLRPHLLHHAQEKRVAGADPQRAQAERRVGAADRAIGELHNHVAGAHACASELLADGEQVDVGGVALAPRHPVEVADVEDAHQARRSLIGMNARWDARSRAGALAHRPPGRLLRAKPGARPMSPRQRSLAALGAALVSLPAMTAARAQPVRPTAWVQLTEAGAEVRVAGGPGGCPTARRGRARRAAGAAQRRRRPLSRRLQRGAARRRPPHRGGRRGAEGAGGGRAAHRGVRRHRLPHQGAAGAGLATTRTPGLSPRSRGAPPPAIPT